MVPIKTLLELVGRGIAASTVTVVEACYSPPSHESGKTGPEPEPGVVGAAMLIEESGNVRFSSLPPFVESAAIELGKKALETGKPLDTWIDPNEAGSPAGGPRLRLFADPYLPSPRLVIAGGGHVGQAIARFAALLGYNITVIDDRPSFANRAVFPDADEVICEPFEEALKRVRIDRSTAVVVVTRGHRHDYQCLRQLARTGCRAAYIGMIGSRRRVAVVKSMLAEEGVPAGFIDQLHAPIGLDIGAQTPAEIALSIMAEIVMERNHKTGDKLSATTREGRMAVSSPE